MYESNKQYQPKIGKVLNLVKPTSNIFRPIPTRKTMQTRLDTYRLNNPSPISINSYYDVEMAKPVQVKFMDRSFSPIQTPSKPTSPYTIPSLEPIRSQSPIQKYMSSLDDSDVKYDDNDWGFHDKEFKGGKRKQERTKTRKMTKSRRKSRKQRLTRKRRSRKQSKGRK